MSKSSPFEVNQDIVYPENVAFLYDGDGQSMPADATQAPPLDEFNQNTNYDDNQLVNYDESQLVDYDDVQYEAPEVQPRAKRVKK